MGAWKRLNQQDAFVTTYNAKKTWTVESGSFEQSGVQALYGVTSSFNETRSYVINAQDLYTGDGSNNGNYQELVYRSINQLYYQNFERTTGTIETSGSYEYYPQTSFGSGTRYLRDTALVYSIPRNQFGTHIEPGSFRVGYNLEYVSPQNDYVQEGFFNSGPLIDDGEGNLVISQSAIYQRIGNIFYAHGMVVVTDKATVDYFMLDPRQDVSWKSNHPIYTHNFHCKVSDFEFNNTQNPSAVSGSTKTYIDAVTGSNFQPYITTVGLYNDANELIAVGKLAQPTPKPANTEMTIQIKLDI